MFRVAVVSIQDKSQTPNSYKIYCENLEDYNKPLHN